MRGRIEEDALFQAVSKAGARRLLLTQVPGAHRKFETIARKMAALLEEVREVFPFAEFFVDDVGALHLMLDIVEHKEAGKLTLWDFSAAKTEELHIFY